MRRERIFFKVLRRNQSCNGGKMTWSLPKNRPSKWHVFKGLPRVCVRGLHVTEHPLDWSVYVYRPSIYLCEVGGRRSYDWNKVAVQKCRLLRLVRPKTKYDRENRHFYSDFLYEARRKYKKSKRRNR